MKQKKYRVLKKYNRYAQGEIVELNKNTAENMFRRGVIEEVMPEKKEEPKKAPTKKKVKK